MSDILASELPGSEEEAEPEIHRPRWIRWGSRVGVALLSLFAVVGISAIGIVITTDGHYSLLDAAYFSLVTVSTVGYSELPHLDLYPWARVVTAFTIVSGIVVVGYYHSTLTAFFVEGAFGSAVRRRRMEKAALRMNHHYILVGCGRVGRYVAQELHRTGHSLIIIERDVAAMQHVQHELGSELPFIEGDAADDEVLVKAGIARAAGLVTTLSLDRDNLFVTLSARTMNPTLRIISKVSNAQNAAKFLRAGASATISPQQIGGLRLASELLRPSVTAFLDTMVNLPSAVRFHEFLVTEDHALVGKKLRESRLRERDMLVVAVARDGSGFHYNPGPDYVIEAGSRLIVLGPAAAVRALG